MLTKIRPSQLWSCWKPLNVAAANRLGNVVSGIYGGGNYYKVYNDGDNGLGIVVNGVWHRTHVYMNGHGNKLDSVQGGAPSAFSLMNNGDRNTFRLRTH
ncbi:hypothetical protein PVW53_21205 [Seohaeicola sp. SP36]|nr:MULTISPECIES: hypothetical protein [unclassified Seohaeicola]MDD9709800.1 hypothetical protein [Seohaeicola sp. 4SK31]MDD9738024.1 hypothetical protein [Seohaeicola sp. SP36]